MFSILFALFSTLFCVSVTTAQSCGPRYRSADTVFTNYLRSPNYPLNYPLSTTCEWTITAPFGYVVELSFVTFDTQGYFISGSCPSYTDILEVYDGSYRSSTKLRGKYCSNYLPANVYSSGTSLYLRFSSNFRTEKKGFEIKYKAVRPRPNNTICSPFNTFSQNNNIQLSGSSGYIESPLYGSKYPSNMQCTWVITVPYGKKIKLTFSNFVVGGSLYCSSYYYSNYDYVQIKDGRYSFSTSLKTLCGQTLPYAVYSSGRYMWIRFKSNSANDNTRNTTGFKAKYETLSTWPWTDATLTTTLYSDPTPATGSRSGSGSDSSSVAMVIGIVIGVCALVFLVCICACIAHRKRTPGHVTVQAPAVTQTTAYQLSTQNPTSTTLQYPQQMQGGFVPPPPVGYLPAGISSGYPPPTQGSYQHPSPGSYPMSSTGGGTSAPGYPPQSSVPMMPYPQQPIPNDPPPAYPGPPAYPPQTATGQPAPSNPNLPYPPPQGAETQQSSPPYPPAQDTKQTTAPPRF